MTREMSEAKKPLQVATKELGTLSIEEAGAEALRLIEESEFSKPIVASCIGKTRQMMHLALTSITYPKIIVDVLACLGYEAEYLFSYKAIQNDGKVEYVTEQYIIAKIPEGEE